MNKTSRVTVFIFSVIIGTALLILVAHGISGSWPVGATTGVIAGVLSVVLYAVLFRKKA